MFDLIIKAVEQTGYLGVALLMLAENVFPPIPSEVIMPLAGFVAARGDLNPVLVVVAGVAGSVAGTWLWYWAAVTLGRERLKRWTERHGHWLTIGPDDIDRASDWFRRHEGAAVFFGRLVPAVRTLISVPAGIAEMPLPRFLLYTTLGTTLWTTALMLAGYLLENQYQAVADWVNPVSNVVLGGMAAWYVYRVYSQWRARGSEEGQPGD